MSYRRTARGGSGSKPRPPPGFSYVEPVLDALENELRDKVKESNADKRNVESMWPVHQINWQRSRYVYDLYHVHGKISRRVYDYCVKRKLVDAALVAKWKKPGYERLCSTYVINPANYKFGGTSICRVPLQDRSEEQKTAQDPTTGCLGCASGRGAGPRNIFGNKYGQNLAAVQIARERRTEAARERGAAEERRRREKEAEERRRRRAEEECAAAAAAAATAEAKEKEKAGDEETDDGSDADGTDSDSDSDDSDFGPAPAAGVWAGSKRLEAESEAIAEDAAAAGEGGGGGKNDDDRPSKKARAS